MKVLSTPKYASPPRVTEIRPKEESQADTVDSYTPSKSESWAPLLLATLTGASALLSGGQAHAAEACFTTDMAIVENVELTAKLDKAVSRVDPIREKDHQISTAILDNSKPNAVACPEHNLFFTSGMVEQLSDDEMVFAVGHEYAHTRDGHLSQMMKEAEHASPQQMREFMHRKEEEADCVGVEGLEAQGLDRTVAENALRKIGLGQRASATHPSVPSRIENLKSCSS